MLEEENKTLVRRFYETIVSDRDLSIIDEFVTENTIDHNPFLPGQPQGLHI